MCNPAMISMGAQSFGVGMSTVGAFFNAQAQKDALRYQARMAEINARLIDGNARNILHAGNVEESRVKLRGAQAKSSQIAQMASSGIDIAGSNTALARLTGNDVITEVDANTLHANALRAAWGQRIEAGNMRRQATSLRASASSISPLLAGATTLINGAGQVAQSWYNLDKQGAFSNTGSTPKGGVTLVEGDNALLSNWPDLAVGGSPTNRTYRGRGLSFGEGY